MMTSVAYYFCKLTVKHLLCLMNYQESDQFRFLRAACLANLNFLRGQLS
jgi:hypothetical protein